MSSVSIVDYGCGNLMSVYNALWRVGADPEIIKTPEEIMKAERLILPGVGAAGHALSEIKKNNLYEPLKEVMFSGITPMLAICIGMQLLAEKLYEYGEHNGFGKVEGNVIHLDNVVQSNNVIPHMGWNSIIVSDSNGSFFQSFNGKKEFYFCHSYFLSTDKSETVIATVNYGGEFPSVIETDSVIATQFHPEKSQINGQEFLGNFLDWNP